jgi:Xaa-Pro aminopeptidase
MLVWCGRRWGRVCSLTRLVHFGRLPAEVQYKAAALSQIDATMIAATRPGASVGAVFQRCQQEYAAAGYPDEWQLHLQGGPAGYEPREYLATAETPDIVATGQTYAWNPSITGTKSEDTILVGPAGNEILTAIDGWPASPVAVDGQQIDRPAILSIE